MTTEPQIQIAIRRNLRPLTYAALLLLPASAAMAANSFLYGVDAGVGETDNVTLAPSNKVSQTMLVTDLDFVGKEQSRLLDLSATGNFSYLDYLQNAYGNQLIGRFDGTGQVAIVPERVTWSVQDNFGQSALDPFTPSTPNNLQNVNYFSTGPNVDLRLGGTTFLDMSARYARVQYQSTPFNSNRLIGDVSLGRRLSADSNVSLNADTERVMFTDTQLNTDFDRTNAFLAYQLVGSRTELNAQLGATRVEQAGDSTTGGLATLKLSRKVSSSSKLSASVGRELTDAGSSFSTLQSGATGVVGTAPAPQTANSYTNTFASGGWDFVRNRTAISVSGRWDKNAYAEQTSLDYRREGVEFRVARRLTRSFTAQLLGRVYRTEYPNGVVTVVQGVSNVPSSATASSSYTDGTVGGILTWRYGRGLEVNLRAEHSLRDATGYGTGYRENRAFLTIGYRPRTPDSIAIPIDEPVN